MTICQGVWHKPTTEQELLEILASFSPSTKYRIVGGNTGTGVFKHDEDKVSQPRCALLRALL